jgi:hypothetical protein
MMQSFSHQQTGRMNRNLRAKGLPVIVVDDDAAVLPALLITGHPSTALLARARKAGVNIVDKPLFGNALLAVICRAIKH